jgi:glucose-6-phosphate-specific signal transduction histidine kinase
LSARTAAEKQLAQALAQNRELARQHQTLQENERKHLARDLHDEFSQYLNAIKLDAVAIRDGVIADHEAATRASMGIIRSVDHVHGAVRDLIRRLRPAGLDELGLEAAVENCIDHWRRRTLQTEYTLRTTGELEEVCESVSLALYRLVQEGLTNVYKHADARRVDIVLEGPESGAERGAYVVRA